MATKKAAVKKIARSAETGRIVSKKEAKANPKTTVEETVKKPIKIGVIPKKIGEAADTLYTIRQQRLDLQHQIDKIKQFETTLKNHLIDNLPKSSATGAAGKVARAQIVTEQSPCVEDWDLFYGHIKKKGEFDLLNRAVNRAAVKERWNNGKEIPGVGHFTDVKVSITKL